MSENRTLYRQNLTLLTDLYELTMAYGYWKSELYDRETVFHLFFRKAPFGGRYALTCGLELVIDYLRQWRFDPDDIRYLGQLKGADELPLFDESFLNYLQRLKFSCDIDAIPEGTICFPHTPVIRVRGPLLQAQIIETALLNMVNFSTLVATKAMRIKQAARGGQVLEFGLRRAQGVDGGLSASRATFVGGCDATSNVLAGKLYGIPVKGTHAHSWVMCFDTELEAFAAYAKALPNNCIFLVDTYDTHEGVRNAIRIGKRLRQKGHELLGVRLDSGDLAQLSKDARRMLDEAGFPKAMIVASNEIDEYVMNDIRTQGSAITVWGVGTKLVTAFDQPALGGVYKLAAIRDEYGRWQDRIKLSEHDYKISNPGILQTRRLYRNDVPFADVIFDLKEAPALSQTLSSNTFGDNKRTELKYDSSEDLLVPVFRKGQLVYQTPSLSEIRQRSFAQRELFDQVNWQRYHLGLESQLWNKKNKLKRNRQAQTSKS